MLADYPPVSKSRHRHPLITLHFDAAEIEVVELATAALGTATAAGDPQLTSLPPSLLRLTLAGLALALDAAWPEVLSSADRALILVLKNPCRPFPIPGGGLTQSLRHLEMEYCLFRSIASVACVPLTAAGAVAALDLEPSGHFVFELEHAPAPPC